MATLENNMETVSCRHCGSPVRPGMIRCRECRGLLTDASDDQDEFVVAANVSVIDSKRCARCGTVLEQGIDDCPSCASALLDDLMKGPDSEPVPPPSSRSWEADPSTHRLREPGTSSGSQTEWVPLREVPTPPPKNRSTESAPSKKTASIEDEPPGLFDDDEPAPRPKREPAAPKPAAAKKNEEPAAESEVETGAASSALLASFAAADATLKVEIAAALGKLGDKAAMGPLERHLVDKDVKVRRAVAAALVQLGHPKGKSLLEIAEKKPAAEVMTTPKAPKPKRTGGGMSIDGDMLKKMGLVVVVIGVIAGGVWYAMKDSSGAGGARRRTKKKKTAAVHVMPKPIASAFANWIS